MYSRASTLPATSGQFVYTIAGQTLLDDDWEEQEAQEKNWRLSASKSFKMGCAAGETEGKVVATGSTLIGSETLKQPNLNKILKLPDVLKTQDIPPTVGLPLTQTASQTTALTSWLLEPLVAKVTLSIPTLLRLEETH